MLCTYIGIDKLYRSFVVFRHVNFLSVYANWSTLSHNRRVVTCSCYVYVYELMTSFADGAFLIFNLMLCVCELITSIADAAV